MYDFVTNCNIWNIIPIYKDSLNIVFDLRSRHFLPSSATSIQPAHNENGIKVAYFQENILVVLVLVLPNHPS